MPDDLILRSTLTCPECGHVETETMPTDACQYFYDCKGCGTVLKPLPGDCCVFCVLRPTRRAPRCKRATGAAGRSDRRVGSDHSAAAVRHPTPPDSVMTPGPLGPTYRAACSAMAAKMPSSSSAMASRPSPS